MQKRSFQDGTINSSTVVNNIKPSKIVKDIKGKVRLYLGLLAMCFILAGLMYLLSKLQAVDYPILSSVAERSPVSLELVMPDGMEVFSDVISNLTDSPFFSVMKGLVILTAIISVAISIMRQNIANAVCGTFVVMGVFVASSILEGGGVNSFLGGDNTTTTKRSVIEFGDYVKSGNVNEYLKGIERYSTRANVIIKNAYENKLVTQDDGRSLIDMFSVDSAQLLSVGLAETMANAESKGDKQWAKHIPAVAALSGYILLMANKTEGERKSPAIDSRTGYAILDAAKSFPGFDIANIYEDEVTASIASKVKIRLFLNYVVITSLCFGIVFFMLWAFTYRNMFRIERVFMEEEKMRNMG